MKPAKYIDLSNIFLPITTERLRIRKLTREDFNNIYDLCLQSKTNDWPSGWNMSKEEASDFLDWQLDKYERFDVINEELFNVTMNDLKKRHKIDEMNLSITDIPQRLCGQLLHQGDYVTIKESKQKLIKELINCGFQLQGEPQEIFINHPYCNPPEKLNILLRQQVIEV